MRHRIVNGAPDIDNPNASLQCTFCLGTEVTVDARNGCIVSLVDVDEVL